MLREFRLVSTPNFLMASEFSETTQKKAKGIRTQYWKSRSKSVMSVALSWPFSHSSCCRKRILHISDVGLMTVCTTMQQRALESIVLYGTHFLCKHFCMVDIKINVQCNILE